MILGAKLNGFDDGGAMWRSPYDLSTPYHKPREKNDIVGILQQLYQKIHPFYKQVDNQNNVWFQYLNS